MRLNEGKVLSNEEIRMIQQAAVKIVTEKGLIVEDNQVQAILKENGAWVDSEKGIIRLSEDMIEKALKSVPHKVTLYDQNGNGFILGKDKFFHFSGGYVTKVLDFCTGKMRGSTLKDVVDFTKLADYLPYINGIDPQVLALDVPPKIREFSTMHALLSNTTKHCFIAPLTYQFAKMWAEMGEIVSCKEEKSIKWAISLEAASVPPLQYEKESINILMLAARKFIPLVILTGSIAGASGPITLAGALALKTAEALFAITLTQIVQPGAPIIWGATGMSIMDMRVANMAEAGPEDCLGSIAAAQLAEFYHLPSFSCSFHSDSKYIDYQTGAEKMAGLLCSAFSGISSTINAGAIAKCSAASYEQMVIDHEVLAFINRILEGIKVNKETIALKTIKEVGWGGNYLEAESTLKYLRTGEHLYLEIFDRTDVKSPSLDIVKRAHDKVTEILAKHKPKVSQDKIQKLNDYFNKKQGKMS